MTDPSVIETLRVLRGTLAHGSLTPADQRTPEESVAILVFRSLEEVLCIVDEYRRRIAEGERCRLVEREHVREDGKMFVEFEIEMMSRRTT